MYDNKEHQEHHENINYLHLHVLYDFYGGKYVSQLHADQFMMYHDRKSFLFIIIIIQKNRKQL